MVQATIQAIYRILRVRYANEVAICGIRMMFAYAVMRLRGSYTCHFIIAGR